MSNPDRNAGPKEKAYRRLQQVTPQLFARYLTDKGVSKTCLACGHGMLSTPETMSIDSSRNPFPNKKFTEFTKEETEKYVSATAVHYVTPIPIDASKAATVSNYQYRLVCQNCGFISYFRAANIVFWVEDIIEGQGEQS